ncbi:hypothetical protein LINPERPRIM_LOCUS4511 [Linum perenne]
MKRASTILIVFLAAYLLIAGNEAARTTTNDNGPNEPKRRCEYGTIIANKGDLCDPHSCFYGCFNKYGNNGFNDETDGLCLNGVCHCSGPC